MLAREIPSVDGSSFPQEETCFSPLPRKGRLMSGRSPQLKTGSKKGRRAAFSTTEKTLVCGPYVAVSNCVI